MAQLGIILGPFLWLVYSWFMGCFMAQLWTLWLFYGWFVGCFMAQLGTVLGPFSCCFMAQLGTNFWTEKKGNWTSNLHGDCSCI